jgi:inner membrane protein
MFIGHLPAGYLFTKYLQKRLSTEQYLWLGLLGSVFPDFDIFYFYLIDQRQTLHHSYWTHLPFYWIILFLVTVSLLYAFKKRAYIIPAIFFYANILLHFALDTIVGKIEWLFPFSSRSLYLFEVPAIYDWWVWNFVFHWTFLFEIAVIAWAGVAVYKTYKERSHV